MGTGFLVQRGGSGGAGLNFKIVGDTTKPANPKENMIWVNTDVKLTGYYFQSKQPENMQPGEVWISTGTSSPVEFNALKKNGLQVYPLSANKCVNGAWENMNAEIYIGGKWTQFSSMWDGKLFTPGNQYESVTGGWMIEGDITSEGFISLPSESGGTCTARTNRLVNKGIYTELKLTIESGKVTVYLSDENGTNEGNWYALLENATGTVTIGLDGVPDAFIVTMYTYYGNKATISKIWLE